MVALGYIFTTLNYICYCSSRFLKEKKWMLTLDLIAKTFTVIGLTCLNSLTGAYNMAIRFVVLIFTSLKEHEKIKVNKTVSIGIYIIFQLIYIAVAVLTFKGISSVLVTITASITLYITFWSSPQHMRTIGVFNSFIYLAYQISIKNWAGLLEIVVIISNILSYIKYKNTETH